MKHLTDEKINETIQKKKMIKKLKAHSTKCRSVVEEGRNISLGTFLEIVTVECGRGANSNIL